MATRTERIVAASVGILLACAILAPAGAVARNEGGSADTSSALADTVSMLLRFVRESGCVFIRNGREHDAEAAAGHMDRKYRHYRDRIATPEDFIRLAATKSMMSGKAYLVRPPGGEVRASAEWLGDALVDLRRRRRTVTKTSLPDSTAGTLPDGE